MRGRLASLAVVAALAAAWYIGSPHYALDRLTPMGRPDYAEIAERIDSRSVRQGLARQMGPLLDREAGPPFTRAVILDALSSPAGVRLLVLDPHGDWRFAASAGLPERLRRPREGVMPRAIDMADWQIDREGLSGFSAVSTTLPKSNRLHFRREGFGWVLDRIELGEPLRDE